jgi:hypothetical protein
MGNSGSRLFLISLLQIYAAYFGQIGHPQLHKLCLYANRSSDFLIVMQ